MYSSCLLIDTFNLTLPETMYEKFVEKMVEKAQNRILGDPYDPNTNHGPQVCQ